MSEIKPVYQYKTSGMLINYWQDVDEEIFLKINKDQCYTTRILYPAAAYEALQKENERLTKCLIAANANHEKFERQYYLELNKVEDLTESNAAQAKRIAELEELLDYYKNMVGA